MSCGTWELKASGTRRERLRSCADGQGRADRGGRGGRGGAAAGSGAADPAAAGGEQDLLAGGPLRQGAERERERVAGGGAAVGPRGLGAGAGEEPGAEPGAGGGPAVGSARDGEHGCERGKRTAGLAGAERREPEEARQRDERAGAGERSGGEGGAADGLRGEAAAQRRRRGGSAGDGCAVRRGR